MMTGIMVNLAKEDRIKNGPVKADNTLTTNMETAFVLQLRDEGCFVRYGNGDFGELTLKQVWNVIDGTSN